jgi:Flp pilus assembly pilin Flp
MINPALQAFWNGEEGQDMVEYSLLLAFIALAAVGLLSGIKTQITGLWTTINSTLASTNTAAS